LQNNQKNQGSEKDLSRFSCQLPKDQAEFRVLPKVFCFFEKHYPNLKFDKK